MAQNVRETTVTAVIHVDGLDDLQKADTALSEIGDVAGAAGKEVDKFGESAGIAKKEFDKFGDAAKGIGQEIESILSDTEKTTKSKMMSIANVYKKNGMEMGDAIKRAYAQYGDTVKEFGDSANEAAKKSETIGESIGESSEKGIGGLDGLTSSADALTSALSGAAAAFSIGTLLQNVSEAQQAMNTLQAQTGANASEMGTLGESVQDLYADGIGESLNDVANTAALVNQQFRDLDADTIESITKSAAVMSDTFGTDVNETLRGVNALMVNMGLTAEQAFDYIAAGTQNGLDKSGELSDNIAEYSQLWAQAGFSAEEMFSILQNGLDSGAYNLDKVNDFVKEFTISLSDGRMEENIESFSDDTQYLFERWRNGAASQKDVFESVISDLSSMTNEQEALTIASTTWSALGEDNAMRVITSLNQVNDTYTDVEGTMSAINDIRYDDIGSSLEKVGRSASSMLTETLAPAISIVSDGISAGMDGITSFAKEHHALASGMSTAATTAGVLATGLIAVSGAIKVVKTALSGLSLSGGPVALAIGGIAALAGVAAGLATAMNADEVEAYDGTLEECRNEIELTEAALKKAEEAYGENSDAVKSLKSDLKTLNAQYEQGGGVLGELQEKIDSARETLEEFQEAQSTATSEIDNMEISGMKAVSMLSALQDKANLSNADLDLMSSYADYLNDTFNCNIEVNYDTGELTGFDPTDIKSQIEQIAENNRVEFAIEQITSAEFTGGYEDALKAEAQAAKEYSEALADAGIDIATVSRDAILQGKTAAEVNKELAEAAPELWQKYSEAQDEVNSYKKQVEEYGEIIGMTDNEINEYIGSLGNMDDAYEDIIGAEEESNSIAEEISQGRSEATDILEKYADDILSLAEAYDEAYQAAYDSFSGQFGLFDEASTESETYMNSTVENAQAALDSQIAYWENYSTNIDAIQSVSAEKLGVTQEDYDAFMAYVQNGSEEAAGLADSIAYYLDQGNLEAVAELINTNAELTGMYDEMSSNTAEWQTGLNEVMDETISQMESSVNELDLSDAAAKSATNTMTAYTNAIRMAKQGAVLEAQSMVSSVQSVLDSAGLSYTATGNTTGAVAVPANASGTTNASDVFIAGEQGAELIVGMGGSTVFPASETEKIISAVSEYANFSGGYTPDSIDHSHYSNRTTTYAPVFQLTLNGGTPGVNQKQVKRWMQSAMDDVFASILRTNPSVYVI